MSKRYTQPIPMGWYAIEYSAELQPGGVKPVYYLGREMVVFRTESGRVAVLDAFCPHLGAHLGYGGKVNGESIACPFHAWEFNGDGYCTNIPYAKNMPPKVDGKQVISKYPVQERNQMIWIWYHPAGAEPQFDIEDIPELNSENWLPLDTFDWKINTIPQETGENAADIAHFVYVHSSIGMPEGVVTLEGPKRITLMDSETQGISEDGEVDYSGQTSEASKLESINIGPGFTFQRFSRMFDIVMMGTVTPIDDQNIHLRFNFSLPKGQTEEHKLYSYGVRDEIVRQVEQDIPIWEHKTYLESPTLCDGDGPIAKYRKWFQQFYADPNPKAAAA